MAFPLLVDMGGVPEAHCNFCFDELYKAMAADPTGDDRTIWRPHENPYLRGLVEDVTTRLTAPVAQLQDDFATLITGGPIGTLQKAAPPGMVWSETAFQEARFHLENLPPEMWTVDDYMLAADYMIQRYLPDGVMADEADYLTVRAAIMGKIQAQMDEAPDRRARLDAAQAAALAALLPTTFRKVPIPVFTPVERAILSLARARAAAAITSVTEAQRARMKTMIIEHVQAMILGQNDAGTNERLRSRLFDNFGILNRDFRRIAITESGDAHSMGYVAAQAVGTKVKRIEAYRDACDWCKSIHGRVFTVVAPSDPARNGDTDVWVGKTNIGRSASPRKRQGDLLVERPKEERWTVAAGVQHPHCFISPGVPIYTDRGWRPISSVRVGDLVLTHRGRFRPVTWTLDGVRHTGKVLAIRVSAGGRNARVLPFVTPEHPFLTSRGWLSAGEVAPGDQVTALGRECATCSRPFANPKHPTVRYCSMACAPRPGVNQFATDDPAASSAARQQTAEANRRRMARMTVEQRRALTAAGRAVMEARGYDHLADPSARARGARSAGAGNYAPSPAERAIADRLRLLGCEPDLQHRIPQTSPNAAGRARYWFADIALPAQRIAVEVDGEPWHGRLANGRDARRDSDLAAQGWTVVRVPRPEADADPAAVAERVARLAMNHAGAYTFAPLTVDSIEHREVIGAKLYNFAVADDESYVITGGVVVHNCRGTWQPVPGDPPKGVDPAFAAWLDDQIKASRQS